ncbi:MAG TPA: EAL domain-containing protein [Vicinamibacteria bacterium]|nr:EAL domain-containing protein [Vicinamibacteria bacterium]
MIPRALIVSPTDLTPELGRTALWRESIPRTFVADHDQALAALREGATFVLLDAPETGPAADFLRRVRHDPGLRGVQMAVLARDFSLEADQVLRAAGANLVLTPPVEPRRWDARLVELLYVPPRRDARLPVRVAAWSSEASGVAGTTLNISLRGILMECPARLEVGARLDVSLRLPGQPDEIRVVGEVVRDAGRSNGEHRSGVKFVILKGDAREAIARFVDGSAAMRPPDEVDAWEAELRASDARKAAILDAALDPIVTIDGEGRVVEWNRAAEDVFGWTRAEAFGKLASELIIPLVDREAHRRGLQRYLATGEVRMIGRRSHVYAQRRDGATFPAEVTVTEVRGLGRPLFTAHVRDLSETRRAAGVLREREGHLRLLAAQAPAVLWSTDRGLRFTSSAGTGLDVLSLRANELVGRTLLEYFGPGQAHDGARAAHEAALRGEATSFELDWKGRTFQALVEPLRGEDAAIVGVAGVALDITDRKAAELALRESEERYRLLFERNLAGVYRTSMDGRILDCNDACARVLGYDSREDLLRASAVDLYFEPAEREAALEAIRERGSLTNHETRLRRKDGRPVWVIENVTLVPGEAGVMEGTLIDVSEQKLAAERLAHQAYHDALTGLPNRLLFTDRLKQALAQARRKRHGLAVFYLDIDEFKRVNDTLGHTTGDRLLQQVAGRLVGSLRLADTVARTGGDEFLVMLPEADADDAVRVVRKVSSALERPFDVGGSTLHVTASVGISLFPNDGGDPETLLRNADNAMYRAKDTPGEDYQLFTPEMNARAVRRLALEQALRRGLERDEFYLRYQPLVRAADGGLAGFEALLRWREEKGLEVPPSEFIPLAEDTRLIVPLGDRALRRACLDARRWRDGGLRDARLAVNVSARQFLSGDFVATVSSALQASGLPPEVLELEITESAAMHDVAASVATLRALADSGVRIALDDFGTGHAALSYVKRFPLHSLKIDQAFTRDVLTDAGGAIVTAIIEMAHALGLTAVAEGVESEAQLVFLRERGCDELQGYYFSSPLLPTELHGRFPRTGE